MRAREAVLTDACERTRHAIGNNSWLLLYRLLDVPGAHPEVDARFPQGAVEPVETEVLMEKDRRGWTALHAMCFHGCPADICVHAMRQVMRKVSEDRRLAEQEAYTSSEDSGLDDDGEDGEDGEDEDEDDFNPFAVLSEDTPDDNMPEEEQPDYHPLAGADSAGNTILHLLQSRATTEGDGMQRIKRDEHRRILAISRVLLAVEPQLARQKNMSGHTPFHEMILASGASGQLDLKLLRLFHRVYPSCCADPLPSERLPLHELCLRGSAAAVVAAVLRIYPQAARIQDKRKQRTPLHYALMNKDPSVPVVRMLLDAFPTAVEITDKYGRSPLITAVIAAGPDHPPPMALLRMCKGLDEWTHPVPQIYRSFSWYAAGTDEHPHVVGKDFNGVDMTTPAVLHSMKIDREEIALQGKPSGSNNPRRHVRDLVERRIPGRFNKMALEIISPKRGAILPKSPSSNVQAEHHTNIEPEEFSFRWYAEGNTSGPDFLGATSSKLRADKLHHKVDDLEALDVLPHTGQAHHHRPFQLSSTITGHRRAKKIGQLNLSPRYTRRLQEGTLASRDYDRDLRRHVRLREPLSVPYFAHPVLLRRETPVEFGGGLHGGRMFSTTSRRSGLWKSTRGKKTWTLPDSTLRVRIDDGGPNQEEPTMLF